MRVASITGDALGLGRTALRNAVKLLPWQFAHLAVSRIILDTQTSAMVVFYIASLTLAVATVVVAVRHRWQRPIHDLLAGTRVVFSG